MIKVKLIYRNYKPLHSMFATYAECPPDSVEFDIPSPKSQAKFLSKLHRIQRKFGDYFLMKWLVTKVIDPFFFGSSMSNEGTGDIDMLHYLNMIPSGEPKTPYIVEIEHVSMLFGYGNKDQQAKARRALLSDFCKAIICSSQASIRTVKEFMGPDYGLIEGKIHQIYPAICGKYISPVVRKSHDKTNILFVGNLCYLKGLEEVFMALESEPEIREKISLDVISNDAKELIGKYPNLSGAINSYMPTFSKNEILEKFFTKADFFLMPTKRDTFGFAVVDAIATGLPVISTKQFAIPELIGDGEDGILLGLSDPTLEKSIYLPKKEIAADMVSNPDRKLVEELRRTLKEIAGGKYDTKKMGEAGLLKVRPGGKFSAITRNELLAKVYTKIAAN